MYIIIIVDLIEVGIIDKITSMTNPFIKDLKKLKDKSKRHFEKKFLVEGYNCVSELIENIPELIKCILVTEKYRELDIIKPFNCIEVPASVMDAVCEAKTPQGIVALCDMPSKKENTSDLIIYLDNVKDPGNVGTIIRTADAAGIKRVILSKESADLYSSKTVRATMGSMFHIDVVYEDEYLSDLKFLKNSGFNIVAGSLDTEKSLYEVSFKDKTVICIGNEAHGISDELYALGTDKIKIPILGKAESLNAAVAGAIIMYEAVRQKYE